jgi:hypothetical protein
MNSASALSASTSSHRQKSGFLLVARGRRGEVGLPVTRVPISVLATWNGVSWRRFRRRTKIPNHPQKGSPLEPPFQELLTTTAIPLHCPSPLLPTTARRLKAAVLIDIHGKFCLTFNSRLRCCQSGHSTAVGRESSRAGRLRSTCLQGATSRASSPPTTRSGRFDQQARILCIEPAQPIQKRRRAVAGVIRRRGCFRVGNVES